MKLYKIVWRKVITFFVYVGIPIMGLTILLRFLPQVNPLVNFEIVVFMLINIFSEFLVVKLPNGIQVSLSHPVMICILILFGPVVTMWTYLPGMIISHLLKNKSFFKIIFNVSMIAISIYLVSFFLPEAHSDIVLIDDFFWLLMVTVLLDLINFAFVAIFISTQGKCGFFAAFRDIWFKEMLSAIPLYYAAGLIMAICYQSQGILGALLVVAPLLGVFSQLNIKNKLKNETERARTDSLTGLLNRYALSQWWEQQLPQILNSDADLTVFMVDIDDFKQVNDRFGHAVGDKVLTKVAKEIEEGIRQDDIIFRFGGEEFVILLPGTNIREAKSVAERIRFGVSQLDFEEDISRVSVSVGLSDLDQCAELCQAEMKDNISHELIRRADNAMYMAKKQGKNQIWIYS